MIDNYANWIASWSFIVIPALGEALWRGLLITGAGILFIRFVKPKAATRHFLWLVILFFVCALPVFMNLPIERAELNETPATGNFFATEDILRSDFLFQFPLHGAMGFLIAIACVSLISFLRLGVAFISLMNLRKFSKEAPLGLQQMLAECISQMALKRNVTVRLSSKMITPALMGFYRSFIIFPESLVANLSSEEIRQVMIHELAHLKRYDDWAVLLQRILTALFIFHPVVIWIGKQMDLEREIACDDAVIDSGGTPRSYALCLTRLAEFASGTTPAAMLSAGSHLRRRVDMLLTRRQTPRSRMLRIGVILGVIAVFGFAVLASQIRPVFAVVNEETNLNPQSGQNPNPNRESIHQYSQTSDFDAAVRRLQQAREKLEAAREEMLEAGEAMRSAEKDRKQDPSKQYLEKAITPEFLSRMHVHREDVRKHAEEMRKREKELRRVEREMRKVEDNMRNAVRSRLPISDSFIDPRPVRVPVPPAASAIPVVHEVPLSPDLPENPNIAVPELPPVPPVPVPEIVICINAGWPSCGQN